MEREKERQRITGRGKEKTKQKEKKRQNKKNEGERGKERKRKKERNRGPVYINSTITFVTLYPTILVTYALTAERAHNQLTGKVKQVTPLLRTREPTDDTRLWDLAGRDGRDCKRQAATT